MPDGSEAIAISVLGRIAEVSAEDWDACAGESCPFVRHAFLNALEESGSASAETGWMPQHLVIADKRGGLLGAVPLYLKNHSYGEYIFDWAWANAYENAGGHYYPKLQSCVPFTPATGPRLLVRPGADQETIAAALVAGMVELMQQVEVSSLHVTFPRALDWQCLGKAGFQQRVSIQYHWKNQGYQNFDDFLARLTSRKRKAIRKERTKALEGGLKIRLLTGAEIKSRDWDVFYRFYRSTTDRKWGEAYLSRDFFQRIGETLADAIVLVFAEYDGEPVAGALNFCGKQTLFGRNWGAVGHFRFLHFELCYYQAIEYAIAKGLKSVEAGAQGEHKIQRGYLPIETYSAHLIRDPALSRAIDGFLEQERAMVRHEIAALATLSPYRQYTADVPTQGD